jgi:diadenosine tetraphosphate (Ap4A) HIT family hydrolase
MNNGPAAGQDVFHAHLHITPRSMGDGYYRFGGKHEVLADDAALALGIVLRELFAKQE